MPNNSHYAFAGWLHSQLKIRGLSPRHFHFLLDEQIAMPRIWKWLRGEGVPHLWEGLLIMQRFQVTPDPMIAKAQDERVREIKSVPQTYFPGMGPRKAGAKK